jgi:hypothetical protein
MLGKSILLTGHDETYSRLATASLRAAGNEVIVANDLDAVLSLGHARAIDLALVRSDATSTAIIEFLSEREVPAILLSDEENYSAALEHFTIGETNHVISASASPAELLTTVEKILRRDTFGIQKYLQLFGVELCTFEIRSPLDVSSATECMEDYLGSLGADPTFLSKMSSAAHELLVNAAVHAPRTPEGHRKYTGEAFREGMTLEPGEYPIFQYGCDGSRFVAAVTDSFGSLRINSIRAAVDRGLSKNRDSGHITERRRLIKPSSGIHTAFSMCSELIFNIHPHELTQCIMTGSLFEPAQSNVHSIHIFVHEDAPEVDPELLIDKESVVVSDSMLIAIKDQAGHTMPAPILAPRPKRATTARPLANWDEDSELFAFEPNAAGIDTMFGLIHGASSEKRVLELGLRFLNTIYEGCIAFRLRDAELHPWLAAGKVSNWELCKQMAYPLIARNTLTETVRAKATKAINLNPDSIGDNDLARFTCVDPEHPCAVACVVRNGRVSHVLFAFEPKFRRAIAGKVLRSLTQELKEALTRIDNKEAIDDQLPTLENPMGDYETIEVSHGGRRRPSTSSGPRYRRA